MATDLIRYDLLVQDALRSVVRTVLADAAKNGLQGDHHFFITFKTNAPGLRLSDRMRERYPDEMTIILQHQYWDLGVTDTGFEVGLSFSQKRERLVVPFTAITTFHDPSVEFGLKFTPVDQPAQDDDDAPSSGAPEEAATPGHRRLAAVESVNSGTPSLAKPAETKPGKPAIAKVPDAGKDQAKGASDEPQKVVSIDAFRKKP